MYVNPPIMNDAAMTNAAGYPIFSTTSIPTNLTKGSGTNLSEIFFGNWADLLIGQWGSLEIMATNIGGNACVQNPMEIRLIMNVDVTVRTSNPSSTSTMPRRRKAPERGAGHYLACPRIISTQIILWGTGPGWLNDGDREA
jgi:Phage capsid family